MFGFSMWWHQNPFLDGRQDSVCKQLSKNLSNIYAMLWQSKQKFHYQIFYVKFDCWLVRCNPNQQEESQHKQIKNEKN